MTFSFTPFSPPYSCSLALALALALSLSLYVQSNPCQQNIQILSFEWSDDFREWQLVGINVLINVSRWEKTYKWSNDWLVKCLSMYIAKLTINAAFIKSDSTRRFIFLIVELFVIHFRLLPCFCREESESKSGRVCIHFRTRLILMTLLALTYYHKSTHPLLGSIPIPSVFRLRSVMPWYPVPLRHACLKSFMPHCEL